MSTQRPSFVLFDLDGTLSDSAPGILAALRHAFSVNGLPQLDPVQERALLGPPFYESLPPLIGAEALPAVITAYRAHYGSGGMYETELYPGMRGLLAALRAQGTRLAVATSKPERFAVPIVEHLGIAEFFDTVGGDELDGSLPTKALVIDKVLGRLGRPEPATITMVGDRSHDVLGARAHDIGTVAVTWGYATPGELESCAPLALCADAASLARELGIDGAVGGAHAEAS